MLIFLIEAKEDDEDFVLDQKRASTHVYVIYRNESYAEGEGKMLVN